MLSWISTDSGMEINLFNAVCGYSAIAVSLTIPGTLPPLTTWLLSDKDKHKVSEQNVLSAWKTCLSFLHLLSSCLFICYPLSSLFFQEPFSDHSNWISPP